MAFWGLADANARISIPTFLWPKGRSSITWGYWINLSAVPATDQSYWRMDGTITPCQGNGSGGGGVRSLLWDNSATYSWYIISGSVPIPTSEWLFYLVTYDQTGYGQLLEYRPSTGAIIEFAGSTGWNGQIINTAPGTADMFIGGTESGGELARVGDGLAELMIFSEPFHKAKARVRHLAHNPHLYRHRMVFYAPLRTAKQTTEPLPNGRVYNMTFRSRSAEALSQPGKSHPPVVRSFLRAGPLRQPTTTRTLRPASDGSNAGWVASDAGTLFHASNAIDAVRATTATDGAAFTVTLG